MILQKESSRFYYFKVDEKVDLDVDGIKSDGKIIKFPKESSRNGARFQRAFKSADQCTAWFNQYKANDMNFVPMQKVAKDIPHVSQKAISVTDTMWEKMKQFMVVPDDFTKDDFVVFESQLANTAPDRDAERFTKAFLKSLMKTIIGKSKLTAHEHYTVGEGVFFDSTVEKYSVDEFVQTLENVPDKEFLYKLNKIADAEGGLYWGVTKYYMNKEIHADKITRIKTGEAAPMSIGFRAPQAPIAVKDERDSETTLFWEWDNAKDFEAEAIEGSDVYLGAQYGARNRKDFQSGNDPDDKNNQSAKTGNTDAGEVKTKKTNEVKRMKFQIKSLDWEKEIDVPEDNQEAIEKAFADIETSAAEVNEDLKQKNTDLIAAQETIKNVKEVFGDEYTVDGLKDAKEKAESFKTLREDLENFLLKSMHALGQIKFDEKETKLTELQSKTLEELFDVRKTVTAELAKAKNFNAAQLSPDFKEEDVKKEEKHEILNQTPYTLD